MEEDAEDAQDAQAQGEAGHCLCIATSMGCMAVISSRALVTFAPEMQGQEQGQEQEKEQEQEQPENVLAQAVLAFHHVKGEPRLLSVVGWLQDSGEGKGGKKKRRQKAGKRSSEDAEESLETVYNSNQGTEGTEISMIGSDSEDTSEKFKKKQKQKKRVQIMDPGLVEEKTAPSKSGNSGSGAIKMIDKKANKKRKG